MVVNYIYENEKVLDENIKINRQTKYKTYKDKLNYVKFKLNPLCDLGDKK